MASLRELSRAIVEGDLGVVREHLRADGSPDLAERGTTLLMEAAHFKQVEIARALVEAGAEVGTTNQDGQSALGFALTYPRPLPAFMITPIGGVSRRGPPQPRRDPASVLALLELLVGAGADLNPKLKDRVTQAEALMFKTPLQLALEQGHPEVIAWLLEHGADPNGSDYDGGTPLQEALFRKRTEIVERLIAAGAEVDPPRWGMLGRAVCYGSDEIGAYVHQASGTGTPDPDVLGNMRARWCRVLDCLARAGADLDRPDDRGRTPLFDAVNGGDPVLLAKVIELGADLTVRCEGDTVLHFLAKLARLPEKNLVPLAAVFRGTGTDFAARNDQGKTAAELACGRGYVALRKAFEEAEKG